jgi:hypothetical protein
VYLCRKAALSMLLPGLCTDGCATITVKGAGRAGADMIMSCKQVTDMRVRFEAGHLPQ